MTFQVPNRVLCVVGPSVFVSWWYIPSSSAYCPNAIQDILQLWLGVFLTDLLTYSMVQSPSWEANWFAASQEIPRISRNPKVQYRTHKHPPPASILGSPNPVHIPTSNLLEIRPIKTPNVPSPYFHPSLPAARCFPWKHSPPPEIRWGIVNLQIVLSPEQASCLWLFLNISVLQGGDVSTPPNPQAGGPLLVGCPRLLIQFIRSYPPYRRPFLYPQPEDVSCRGPRDPLYGGRGYFYII